MVWQETQNLNLQKSVSPKDETEKKEEIVTDALGIEVDIDTDIDIDMKRYLD